MADKHKFVPLTGKDRGWVKLYIEKNTYVYGYTCIHCVYLHLYKNICTLFSSF